MNPSDHARLEIAKRAYQSTQPRAVEVQTGVRRARLWLGRPKPRRNWFSKGLVLVVLALGSLAYAKPQALGELVQNAIRPNPPLPRKHLGSGAAELATKVSEPRHLTAAPAKVAAAPATLAVPRAEPAVGSVAAPTAGAIAAPIVGATEPAIGGIDPTTVATAPTIDPRNQPNSGATKPATTLDPATVAEPSMAAAPAAEARAAARSTSSSSAHRAATRALAASGEYPTGADVSTESGSSSDWGRVGRALAGGDDARALSALARLSESADASTRDKADLGRAQLYMAHGNAAPACAIARSLLQRGAAARIERQAHSLLKICAKR